MMYNRIVIKVIETHSFSMDISIHVTVKKGVKIV